MTRSYRYGTPWSFGRGRRATVTGRAGLFWTTVGRGDGSMKRLPLVPLALVALIGSAAGLHAADSETFMGAASASGTYKRPLLLVDGKRFELKASGKADPSVAETLAKFSKG